MTRSASSDISFLEGEFDHWDPAFASDPYPAYEWLRDECPVAHSDAYGGFWVVSRYSDIVDVCHRPEAFSSRYVSIPKDIGAGDMPLPPINIDPPEHSRFRRILQPAFSPGRIGALEPAARQIVISLLESLEGSSEFDASEQFAKPLPIRVTDRLLGTPAEDSEKLSAWISAIVESGASEHDAAAESAGSLAAYLASLIEQRRSSPGDDLISFISQTNAGDGLLDEGERLGCVFLLLIAGIDTTWSALSSTIWHLARRPDHRERLAADPGLIPTAVEEFLRAFAPTTVARVVREEVELGDRRLSPGDMVLVPFPCANRDRSEFPDADDIVLDRQPNRHLAFGVGIHRCLGSHLARMEMRVALEELLARAADLSLADEAAVTWKTGPMRGPKSLPVKVRWA